MATLPKDPAAPRTLEKLLILLCNIGRNQKSSLVAWHGDEQDVAIRTTKVPPTVHVEIEPEVAMKLVQLLFDLVAVDQGMAATEQLALRQPSIAGEQPPLFAHHPLDQFLIRDHVVVGRVVAENAQPASQTAEHGIGYKTCGRMSDRGYHD